MKFVHEQLSSIGTGGYESVQDPEALPHSLRPSASELLHADARKQSSTAATIRPTSNEGAECSAAAFADTHPHPPGFRPLDRPLACFTCEECDRLGWPTKGPLYGRFIDGVPINLCWLHATQFNSRNISPVAQRVRPVASPRKVSLLNGGVNSSSAASLSEINRCGADKGAGGNFSSGGKLSMAPALTGLNHSVDACSFTPHSHRSRLISKASKGPTLAHLLLIQGSLTKI